jgi:hypothetical protein
VVLACLAIAIVVLLLRLRPWSGVAVSAVLTILWVWPAVAYHLLCFAPINPLTYAFAVLSMVGLEPFAWRDLVQRQLDFGSPTRG